MKLDLVLPVALLALAAPSAASATPAACNYGTLWGVTSTNVWDTGRACSGTAPLGCDLWVYELAWSTQPACPAFVTALRPVTRTAAIGEIDARMLNSTTDSVIGPRVLADTAVSIGPAWASETRTWDTAAFYGFTANTPTALSSAPATGQDVTHGTITLSTSTNANGHSQVKLTRSSDGLTVNVRGLLLAFLSRHTELAVTSPSALDVYGGDFAVESTIQQPRARVYAALSSHNEADTDNADCVNMFASPDLYQASVDGTARLAELVEDEEAAWDLQTDYEYIIYNLGDTFTASQGETVLAYAGAAAPGRVVVEVHTHDNKAPTHNDADVVGWFDDAGLPTNGVVGGFNWQTDVLTLSSTVTSVGTWPTTQNVSWTPSILSFASLGNHKSGSDVKLSGIWRPKGQDQPYFFLHDASGALVNISTGNRTVYGVSSLVSTIAGTTPRLYPATIFFAQCNLELSDSGVDGHRTAAELATEVRSLRPLVNQGLLVWAPMTVTAADWTALYGEQPSCIDTDDVHSCGF